MSACRHDKLTQKTRKAHRCEWCWQPIEAGRQMVRVSGVNHGEPFCGKFHPECWRAEYWWWRGDGSSDDCWPGDRMARGRTDDDFQAPPAFTDRAITAEEIRHRYQFAATWRVQA